MSRGPTCNMLFAKQFSTLVTS